MTQTLRRRLLLSHFAVALVGIAALIGISLAVGDALLNRQSRTNGRVGVRPGDAREAIASVLPDVLVVGGITALLTAAIAAALVTRSVMGPLRAIQEASHRIAKGDYSRRVPTPKDAELAAVADDIDALAHRLAETEARRTLLIDEVAHEMRTPITTIRGSMEALLDEVIEPNPEVFARIADEASRLQRLAEDLSTLSRAEEHTLSLSRQSVDLAKLARGVAERIGPQFDLVAIDASAAHEPVLIEADPDRITQILVNLVGNAMRHGGEGSIVEVAAGRDASSAWVRVTDHGVGLAADEVDRVFERFYRVPTASGKGGRGIGLTIARSLARAHGGDVTAVSQGLGTGSSFTLRLPRP